MVAFSSLTESVTAQVRSAVGAVGESLRTRNATLWLGGAVASLLLANYVKRSFFRPANAPPKVPSWIPVLGRAQDFGERPIDFLMECKEKYGPVFTFTMMGSEITFALGSEASNVLWGSHNDVLNAEDLYRNITTPVFGKGVAYDVPHKVFSEQKQMAKEGLTKERFAAYTGIIEQEVEAYIARWGDEFTGNFFEEMAKLVIFTATRCLHGKETREAFDESMAHLYHDLDGGFTALGWFFPPWVPFPSFLRRDKAHKEVKRRFFNILKQRKQGKIMDNRTDLMETFMTTPYQRVLDGRNLNDDEVAGMLIALLMAGQHTSSTVSSWLMSFLCTEAGLQDQIYAEQLAAFKKMPGKLTIDHLDHMPLLHACVRETLRLRPPIMSIMRRCREDITIVAEGRTYVVPKGGQLCVSPTINGRLEDEWDQPLKFDPSRFLETDPASGEVKVTMAEQLTKGGKFKWVPFGAGRHRCIGFEFAQLQIRCIMSTLLRKYKVELISGKMPEINYKTMLHTPQDPIVRITRRK